MQTPERGDMFRKLLFSFIIRVKKFIGFDAYLAMC